MEEINQDEEETEVEELPEKDIPEEKTLDCSNCRHSRPGLDDTGRQMVLKCHRYPPQVIVLNGHLIQPFPDAIALCSEYEEAQEEAS